ncbi:MAG TPA: SDR family NAD(P)-dependent oxidoreductase, partial [Bellilinea sp.]|nr:SDR family NAD(P)-dependent oxidoreductase [Bellilinea sp.]
MTGVYLVTGAAGFIGAQVSEALARRGDRVIGVDNLNDAYDVRIKHHRLEQLRPFPRFEFREFDLREKAKLDDLAKNTTKIDAVIHLAARAGVRASVDQPRLIMDNNVMGLVNTLEFAHTARIPKFIFASSSSIYGADPQSPTPETADTDHPLQQYTASKKAGETLCHVYHHLYGLDVTIFRYFTVIGPAGRPDHAMFRFIQRISEGLPITLNGDGTQTRGFTFIEDIVRGTLLGLTPQGYEIFNLGGHDVISMNDLIAMIEKMVGRKAIVHHRPFHPGDAKSNEADVTKARTELGWSPQVSLEEAVRRIVEWYQRERS